MESSVPIGTALWLGFLTSISPCLMATNVAAIAYIARRVDRPRQALLSALSYAAGQAVAYVVLGALLVSSLLSIPVVSVWLQQYMTRLLGPFLIVSAVLLLEWVTFPARGGKLKAWAQQRADAGGLAFAFVLGVVFALAFCPVTAALFFGALIPTAITADAPLLMPLGFAAGVALPVLALAIIISLAAHRLGALYARITQVEHWARRLTGAAFLIIGLYFTWAFTLGRGVPWA